MLLIFWRKTSALGVKLFARLISPPLFSWRRLTRRCHYTAASLGLIGREYFIQNVIQCYQSTAAILGLSGCYYFTQNTISKQRGSKNVHNNLGENNFNEKNMIFMQIWCLTGKGRQASFGQNNVIEYTTKHFFTLHCTVLHCKPSVSSHNKSWGPGSRQQHMASSHL